MDTVVQDKSLSLGERLLAGRAEKQAEQGEFTATIQLAGGYLSVTYRALDFREDRKIGQRHRPVKDEVEREIRAAADTLIASCTGCVAHVDGETHSLPPLGLKLTEALGLDGLETDIQAVLAVFPSERALIEQFVELEEWAKAINRGVDKDLEGESVAAA